MNEQAVLLMMRGMIASASPEEREAIETAAARIRTIVAEHGDLGKAACGLVGAELAAET